MRQDFPIVALSTGAKQLLRSGDWLRVVVGAWQAGSYPAGELVYDAGILFRTRVAIGNSQAAPSTYNSGQFFEQLTRPDAFINVNQDGSVLTFTRANGSQVFVDLPTGGTPPEGSTTPATDVFDVPAAKRQAIVSANAAAVAETDTTYFGREFYDEVSAAPTIRHYRCAPSAQANGSTAWKWFRSVIS